MDPVSGPKARFVRFLTVVATPLVASFSSSRSNCRPMKIIAIHSMDSRRLIVAIAIWVGLISLGFKIEAADAVLKISNRPLHGSLNDGRISPMLFGNFVELLDDLCPGMWAEMLNDRGFEGVRPPANWVYYDGSPTFCDRQWDRGTDWEIETKDAFNGPRCARIT